MNAAKTRPNPSWAGTKNDKPEIRFLGDLQRIEVKPGDKFVLTVEEIVTADIARDLGARVSASLGGVDVIVLGRGMKLGVISPTG